LISQRNNAVAKEPDGRYRPGKVGWVKVRTQHSQEMVIGG
jgi:ATP-dependent DNA ligase